MESVKKCINTVGGAVEDSIFLRIRMRVIHLAARPPVFRITLHSDDCVPLSVVAGA